MGTSKHRLLYNMQPRLYLLVVDFYSKYPEVIPMMSKTANATIAALKSIFTRRGIPNKLIADNMPFNSKEFPEFSKKWSFKVVTSSPKYPQSNGLAERNVQTIMKLLKKARKGENDEKLALLELRNTPITDMSYSPAQLVMNKRLRGSLSFTAKSLEPSVPEGAKSTGKTQFFRVWSRTSA